MPDYEQVTRYLTEHHIESELSDLVSLCVEDGTPQPLARIAAELAKLAAEAALEFDYPTLVADITALLQAHDVAPLFMSLSWHDAGMYSAALGGGKPNSVMRFTDGGEGAFAVNKALAGAVALLAPIRAKHACISHADLWALAANVALEFMGGPKVPTRFGRLDAASSAESVESAEGRVPDDDKDAAHLRAIFRAKGFNDREIVAFAGRHTVGACDTAMGFSGQWTREPRTFDNSYFVDLLNKRWRSHRVEASGKTQMLDESGTSAMLLTDLALREDLGFRPFVERYANDQPRFFADFAAVWAKMQELGCTGLRPHPQALDYASTCYLPTDWIELPLVRRAEYNHDTTRYAFGLPEDKALDLPVCACLLVKAPGAGGRDEWDPVDAVRPYTPISGSELKGRFELLVKRYDGGAVSQYLHRLPLGANVAFRHIKFNIKTQYPFEGKRTISLVCAGSGITPMFQALTKLMGNPADEHKVTAPPDPTRPDSKRGPRQPAAPKELLRGTRRRHARSPGTHGVARARGTSHAARATRHVMTFRPLAGGAPLRQQDGYIRYIRYRWCYSTATRRWRISS